MCCDPRVGGMGVGWAGFADEDLHVWEVVHASSILLTAVWRTAYRQQQKCWHASVIEFVTRRP